MLLGKTWTRVEPSTVKAYASSILPFRPQGMDFLVPLDAS